MRVQNFENDLIYSAKISFTVFYPLIKKGKGHLRKIRANFSVLLIFRTNIPNRIFHPLFMLKKEQVADRFRILQDSICQGLELADG